MEKNRLLERLSAVLVLISAALVVCGTRACQEDYDLGSQATRQGSPTATATTTAAGGEDDDGTVRATATGTAIAMSTATGTATATGTVSVNRAAEPGLLQQLSAVSEGAPRLQALSAPPLGASQRDGNWLGKGFGGADNSVDTWIDSDGDGYSDKLEQSYNSSPADAMDLPAGVTTTRLAKRVRIFDSDLDGLVNDEELRRGTDPQSSDSDGDGLADGAEVSSGGDPLSADDPYLDSDGDGLSDTYEREHELDPGKLDTDEDGLRDDLELVVGSNGQRIDSDGDGIADGREFDLGTDPMMPEGE